MGLNSVGRLELEIGLLRQLSDRRTKWTTIQRREVVPKSGGEVLRPFNLLARGVERLASVMDQSGGVATLSIMAVRERYPVQIGFSADELETLARQEVSLQVDFYLEDDAAWNAQDEASFVAADGRAWVDCGHRRVPVNLGEERDGTAIREAITAAAPALLVQKPHALTFDVYARELGNSVLLYPAELGVLGESRLDLRYVLMPAPDGEKVVPAREPGRSRDSVSPGTATMRIAVGDAETVTSAWRAMTLAEGVFSQRHDEVDHRTGEAVYHRIAPLIGPLDEAGGFRTTESIDIDYVECAFSAHELEVISQALDVAAELLGEADYEIWTGSTLASTRETLQRLARSTVSPRTPRVR